MRINTPSLRNHSSLFFVCLLITAKLSATAPTIGTTTFNGNFSATGSLIGPSATPLTASNVGNTSETNGILASGWDFTATNVTAGTNVSIAAIAGGANPGGAADYCIRALVSGSGVYMKSVKVASDDASNFDLQSVYFRIGIASGTADITITGYKNGVAVSGATMTITGLNNDTWTLFNLAGVSAFASVNSLIFTQAASSSNNITNMVVDQITINAAVTLPLTLVDFSGQRTGNAVQLDWTTASEQNTSNFQILRGTDGQTWAVAGQVAAAGNSTQALNYQYTDTLPNLPVTTWFYRLRMGDLDGAFTYSPVLAIGAPAVSLTLSAYPNPFSQQLTVQVESPGPQQAAIMITDINGRLLINNPIVLQKGSNIVLLPSAGRLANGIYLLILSTTQGRQVTKVVKSH